MLNMSTDECWMFPFHQWLSSVKTRIRAQRTKIEQTGEENLLGIVNVYVSVFVRLSCFRAGACFCLKFTFGS